MSIQHEYLFIKKQFGKYKTLLHNKMMRYLWNSCRS